MQRFLSIPYYASHQHVLTIPRVLYSKNASNTDGNLHPNNKVAAPLAYLMLSTQLLQDLNNFIALLYH
jgi:hypothetical protein